ncbi:CD3324 family protein [Clostridiaceae bacterium M8S5]|nr:CD3324 family protein [Clostridiaceae bacterium M8S5]
MNYTNAKDILPNTLVKEIQKYIQGEYLYIPSSSERKKWGENSGSRESIKRRNEDIRQRYNKGITIQMLSEEFFLSIHSIKKIVYTKNKNK